MGRHSNGDRQANSIRFETLRFGVRPDWREDFEQHDIPPEPMDAWAQRHNLQVTLGSLHIDIISLEPPCPSEEAKAAYQERLIKVRGKSKRTRDAHYETKAMAWRREWVEAEELKRRQNYEHYVWNSYKRYGYCIYDAR